VCNVIQEQYYYIICQISILIDKVTFEKAKEQSILKLKNKEIIFNIESLNYITKQIYNLKKNKKLKLRLSKYNFPDPKTYVKMLNLQNLFSKNNYFIKTDDIFIPSFKQKVIEIRPNGIQEVYDIEVNKVHNFLANGIVSHNCALYPTT